MMSDIKIAREATLLPIPEVAASLGLSPEDLDTYGKYKPKIRLGVLERIKNRPDGKPVLCTSITPTPAGEGKTATNVGLSMALGKLGKKAVCTLCEPSPGPCFGAKGGAAGGGYAQVVPMEDINLHSTGDIHAITAAHDLCAAVLDNHLFQGNELQIDPSSITRPRVLDLNDRALRQVTVDQGGEGIERRTRFDISLASEVSAILCLAIDRDDLKSRLESVVLGHTRWGRPIRAKDLKVSGSMAVLLKDALMPNLVQTLENTPAITHGGRFANIAHGCNSVQATRLALKLGDYCITEAGFGADLGAEKFFDIKCRYAGLVPDCVVLVATVRALKMHGGVGLADLRRENREALSTGIESLEKHLENMQLFGPPVVAINRFPDDTEAESALLRERVGAMGANVVLSDVWTKGGKGGFALAEEVLRLTEGKPKPAFRFLYDLEASLVDKVETICIRIYGTDGVDYTPVAQAAIEQLTELGYGSLPVCMAKTQASLSDDKTKIGRPRGWRLTVREVRLSAGAWHDRPCVRQDDDHARSAQTPGGGEHRSGKRSD